MDTGQHADHGTFPEWEKSGRDTPVTSENLSTVRAQAGNPFQSLLSLGGPLSPGSAQRRDKPLSSPPATGHVDP